MKYLTKEHIVLLNKSTVDEHGGNFIDPSNFLLEANLDYLIDEINTEMFREVLIPFMSEKAAIYCYNIVANHVFTDGN